MLNNTDDYQQASILPITISVSTNLMIIVEIMRVIMICLVLVQKP